MASTIKRVSVSLSKKDIEELEALSKHFGEHMTQVVRRGLILLYERTFNTLDKKKKW